MKKKHFMLDIETFGTEPYSVILSIGCVHFDPSNLHGPISSFYVCIDPIDAQKRGLRIDASTVMWWMQPDQRPAWDQWANTLKFPLHEALTGFSLWMQELDQADPPDELINPDRPFKHRVVWGNGAAFDNELVKQAFKIANIELPWDYGGDRCFRTMRALPCSAMPDSKRVTHKADDDALYQAHWLQQVVADNNLKF